MFSIRCAVTHDLEMDNRPTLNYVLLELAIIREALTHLPDDGDAIKVLKTALVKALDYLYKKRVTVVHHAATALTPPFRLLAMCPNSDQRLAEVKAYLRVMMKAVSCKFV